VLLSQTERLFKSLEIAKDNPNLNEVQILIEILDSIAEQADVSETWLNQPTIDKVRSQFQTVRAATEIVNFKFDEIQSVFNESIVTEDAANLLRRFSELHKGLRKLSKKARLDKKTLRNHSPIGKFKKSSIPLLEKVIELQEAIKQMTSVTEDADALLGKHLKGRETQFDKLSRAIDVAGYLLANERRVLVSPKVRSLLADRAGIPSEVISDFVDLGRQLPQPISLHHRFKILTMEDYELGQFAN
jgi:hypothetical protein